MSKQAKVQNKQGKVQISLSLWLSALTDLLTPTPQAVHIEKSKITNYSKSTRIIAFSEAAVA